jgi:hypothetical protein
VEELLSKHQGRLLLFSPPDPEIAGWQGTSTGMICANFSTAPRLLTVTGSPPIVSEGLDFWANLTEDERTLAGDKYQREQLW